MRRKIVQWLYSQRLRRFFANWLDKIGAAAAVLGLFGNNRYALGLAALCFLMGLAVNYSQREE
ncbi:hypothetical protein FACS1894107_10420 [Planctomycetales bacterium]|nr:hypothetical protein FACS1894107_10420 [Planctomycetales bacterium]GHS98009.1 hypothetical protein FACS1894108_05380 [Planctomycetales bacterium]